MREAGYKYSYDHIDIAYDIDHVDEFRGWIEHAGYELKHKYSLQTKKGISLNLIKDSLKKSAFSEEKYPVSRPEDRN